MLYSGLDIVNTEPNDCDLLYKILFKLVDNGATFENYNEKEIIR